MAKPGSDQARSIANGRAVDLTRATLSDAEARDAQEQVEHALGARCDGCGRRIVIGMKFTSIAPRDPRPVLSVNACSREDCDYMEQASDGATFMEMVEFAWLDENGPEAPPSMRHERREQARAAAEQREGSRASQADG